MIINKLTETATSGVKIVTVLTNKPKIKPAPQRP